MRIGVSNKFSLDGAMIPRSVKRVFDQRDEPRDDASSQTAMLSARARRDKVPLVNLSSSGAMVVFSDMLHIGEEVTLELIGHGEVAGHVRWIRDGRVGIRFAAPLG